MRAAGRRMQPLGTAIEGAGHAGRATGERFIMASAWRCNGGIRYRLTAPSDTPVRYHRSGVGLQPAARGDGCTGGVPQPLPNTMEAQASFTAQVLKFGLLGTTQTTPRLARANFQTAHTFAGEGTDNLPLWVFVRSDVLDSPGRPAVDPACRTVVMNSDASGQPNSSIGYDYFDLKEMMLDCLDGFGAPGQGDKIFDERILTSSRFAWIPQIDETTLSGLDKKKVHINSFVPVFIHKLYQQGKSVGSPNPFCWAIHPAEMNTGWYMHEAGQQTGACGRSNQNVDRVAAVVLHCAALPDTVCIDDTTSDNPGGQPVYSLELTK